MNRERTIVASVAIATAITRWLALARSFWDWDEALFILGLRHFDVAAHHPHPPGFPLYIAVAKIVMLTGCSAFHALQTINFASSVLIVPVAYAFARALDFRFSTSLAASVLLAFFPNVWLFGGSAFSDVPAMALALAASALLLRGARSDRAFFAGCVFAAFAIGFRSQNVIVIAVPFIAGSWRNMRRALIGATICSVIVFVAYGWAAAASGGWTRYRAAIAEHEQFIRSVDSIGAPGRPPLINVAADFLVRPYRAPLINALVAIFAAIGGIAAIVQRKRGQWIAIASFAPVAILAVLYLNWLSASRFAIGYAPLVALLAADGLTVAARKFDLLGTALVAALMIGYAWPAIVEVRSTVAPPVAAAQSLQTSHAFVDSRMAAQVEAARPDVSMTIVDMTALPVHRADGVLIAEDWNGAATARNFVRPRIPLAQLVRPRYFEASVVPMRDLAAARGSTLVLPPLHGDGQLTLGVETRGPVTVKYNGRVIDTFVANGEATRSHRELSRRRAMNEVEVTGGRLVTFGWLPAF